MIQHWEKYTSLSFLYQIDRELNVSNINAKFSSYNDHNFFKLFVNSTYIIDIWIKINTQVCILLSFWYIDWRKSCTALKKTTFHFSTKDWIYIVVRLYLGLFRPERTNIKIPDWYLQTVTNRRHIKNFLHQRFRRKRFLQWWMMIEGRDLFH